METLLTKTKDPKTLQLYFGGGIGFACFTVWYNIHAASCISFFLGIVFTLATEFGAVFYFINRKASPDQNNLNVQVTLAELIRQPSLQNLPSSTMSEESTKRLLEDLPPLSSKTNISEDPFTFNRSYSVDANAAANNDSAFDESDKSAENLDISLDGSKKRFNKLRELSRFGRQSSLREAVMGKMRRGDSKKELVAKIGHKKFKRDLDQYHSMFELISSSEERFGKDMQNFPICQDLTHASDEYDLQLLSKSEVQFLAVKFQKELKFNEVIIIPDWNKIKETIYFVGTIHFNLSSMTDKYSKGAVEALQSEYESKYLLIKNQKSSVKKEHEDALQFYIKNKSDHDTLQASLNSAMATYRTMVEERVPKETLLKHEMKTRLLEMQVNSAKNKLSDATDKLGQKAKNMEDENTKINQFVEEREVKRNLLYKNVCKNFIEGLIQKLADAETILSSLIQFKQKTEISMIDSHHHLPADSVIASNIQQEMLSKQQTSSQIKPKEGKRKRFFKALVKPLKKGSQKQSLEQSFKQAAENPENAFLNLCYELKERFEHYDQINKELRTACENELKKGRNNLVLLKYFTQSLDKYIKEKSKVFGTEFCSESTVKFSKLIKDAISFTVNNNMQLFQEIWNIENRHAQSILYGEEQILNHKYMIQEKMKKLEHLIQEIEEKSGAPSTSLRKSVKKFFKKASTAAADSSSVGDDRDNEESFEEDKLTLLTDLDKETSKLEDTVDLLHEKNIMLKKQLVLTYLSCYYNQKQHLQTLSEQVEKISDPVVAEEEIAALTVLSEAERQIEEAHVEVEPQPANLDIDFDVQKEEDISQQIAPKRECLLQRSPTQTQIPTIKKETLDTFWFNKMLDVFFIEWARSDYFKEKMVQRILRSLNKRQARYKFLKEFNVKDFVMEPKAPEIRQITLLPTDSKEFVADFDISYEGNMLFEIEAKIEPQKVVNVFSKDYSISMTARVLLKRLKGKMRICWKPTQIGPSWFCFVGDPCIDVHIDPLLGHRLFNMTAFPKIESLIRDRIAKKLGKLTFPHKKEIRLPLAFKSPHDT